ncbi:serpin B [Arthrobacter pigmenti]|uniref:Serpin B n=1 Tax=Arthrobacter pigmenti TaxID=271432 RepID=A0A846RFF5_9MICC|nr:serpin family protein [Arthrobacter pigmenti]NJC21813.1 serpin B [Arthrobacter pigmenti]
MGIARRMLVTSVVAAEALLLTACGAAAPEQRMAEVDRQAVGLDDHPDAVAALRSSAYRLGAEMLAVKPEANQVTSPVSALAALAMLRVGAQTTTADELDSVLGFPAEHRDAAMNALLAEWAQHDGDPGTVDDEEPPEEPLLHLANGLFVAEDLELADGFLEPLAQHYGVGVYPVDYSSSSALEAMNAWVNQHTGGRIEEVPIKPSQDTVLNIINTVYFAAAWANPFDPTSTVEGTFTTGDGPVQADLMHTTLRIQYAAGDGWQGIDLPYNNGFVMRLVLPEEGRPPAMDQAALADIDATFDEAPETMVDLTLPSWDHAYDLDLKKMLISMGLDEAMGLTPDYTGMGADLFVEGVAQAANITVAEKGTVASAVTQISMQESGAPETDVEIVFDRPFLYQILHEETGMPMFLGTVMDPTVGEG